MDEKLPWEIMDDEPENWFLRFTRYLNAGGDRSFLGVYNAERAGKGIKKALRISGAWDLRVKEFSWADRAKQYDAFLAQEDSKEWDKRRKELREKEMSLSKRLVERAEQMMQFPLARTEKSVANVDGKTVATTIVIPSGWRFIDILRTIEASDKLARLALDMETNREAIDATIGSPVDMEEARRKRWEQVAGLLPSLDDTLEVDEEEDDPDNAEE